MSEQATDRQDGTKGSRVVLRGVRAVVLDDLPAATRLAIADLSGAADAMRETWLAVSVQPGTNAEAIAKHAGPSGVKGNTPGSYKAVPAASWFVSPLVVEPPLG